MKIIKKLLTIVGLFVILVAAVGLLLPATTTVKRSITISAPPEQIFPYLIDFKEFNRWSPWYGIDPSTEYTFSGADKGVGARIAWVSENSQVGSGNQEVIAVTPYSSVKTALAFDGQGDSAANFDLTPTADGTEITWTLEAGWSYNPMMRILGYFKMDDWVGSKYQQGLESLKAVVESQS